MAKIKVQPEDTEEGQQVIRDEAAAEVVYKAAQNAAPGKLAGYWKPIDGFGGCVWVPTGPKQ